MSVICSQTFHHVTAAPPLSHDLDSRSSHMLKEINSLRGAFHVMTSESAVPLDTDPEDEMDFSDDVTALIRQRSASASA